MARKPRGKLVKPLFEGAEWDFDTLKRTYDAIEDIAINDLGLKPYRNQIEIISAEQMLDAYSSIGMPLMYQHWSFGKHFARDETNYRKGRQGLAYEIVINSNPCISYCMEENTMTMQALVMAHAAFGHNHFFANNYLFKQWTDADGILDYLTFAKDYINHCEQRYGFDEVEALLDSAHALMSHGVDRYHRPEKLSAERERERVKAQQEYEERSFNDLWRTVPQGPVADTADEKDESDTLRGRARLPEENILYFLEKNSPTLKAWQREIIRIVRKISQYFYPQKQTKVMNEGFATFVHHYIMNRLWDKGMITDGAWMEFTQSHTNVVFQPDFDDPRYGGFNPYAIGFDMMQDIKRICENPTDEDREWFDFAGNLDWRAVLLDAVTNYRDESFILQYLSPTVMRKRKLFLVHDDEDADEYDVTHIHNGSGFRDIRRAFSRQYNVSRLEPDIQVMAANLRGSRTLVLHHRMCDDIPLDEQNTQEVLKHISRLWGYKVVLDSRDADDQMVHRYEAGHD